MTIHKRSAWCALLVLGACGCSQTLASTPFSDGTVVRVAGYGAESQVAVTCLTEDQINQLTGGNTPPGAAKASCYEVAVITTKSSQISNAITAYFQAQKNLSAQAAAQVAPVASTASGNPVADSAAKAIVADVVAGKPDAIQNAAGLKANLSAQTRTDVANELQSISSGASDPAKAAAIKAAADAVK